MANDVTINVKANTAQAQSQLSALNKSFVGINSAIEIGQKAAQALGQAYDFLAGDTMKYAAQVRQMMRVSGQNAEMTSRMIQLTDDFGLSNESLTAAMRGASMKGIAFTVDSLAKLSDEYNKLAPGTERNTFLIQSFGRAGLEMAKVMEKGGKAIREQAAAQADNLIMTQANLDAAEALRIAEDNLNDSFQGIKYTIGNELIPELVKAANAFETLITWNQQLSNVLKQHEQEVRSSAVTYQAYKDEMIRAANAAGLVVQEHNGLISVYEKTTLGVLVASDAFRIMSQAERENIDVVNSDVGVTQSLINSKANLVSSLESLEAAQSDVNALMQAYTEQLLFQMAAEGLSEEQKIRLADALGLIDERTRFAIVKTQELKAAYEAGLLTIDQYIAQTAALGNQLDRIVSKDVTITVHYAQTGSNPSGEYIGAGDDNLPGGRAAGGPVMPFSDYLVGERGPEILRMGASGGTVIPNNQISNTWGGITVVLPNVTNGQQFYKELAKFGKQYQGL